MAQQQQPPQFSLDDMRKLAVKDEEIMKAIGELLSYTDNKDGGFMVYILCFLACKMTDGIDIQQCIESNFIELLNMYSFAPTMAHRVAQLIASCLYRMSLKNSRKVSMYKFDKVTGYSDVHIVFIREICEAIVREFETPF